MAKGKRKGKKMMPGAQKDASRARKVPRTEARKRARRTVQEQAAALNRVRRAGGEATPWELSEVRRKARSRGIEGAA